MVNPADVIPVCFVTITPRFYKIKVKTKIWTLILFVNGVAEGCYALNKKQQNKSVKDIIIDFVDTSTLILLNVEKDKLNNYFLNTIKSF